MSFRITTNGMFRNYRSQLYNNTERLQQSMRYVETGRKFNSYSEDVVSAGRAFQLRRRYWRTSDQIDNSNHIISKYEAAFGVMESIVDGDTETRGLDGIRTALMGLNDPQGTGRNALGRELIDTAKNIVALMNSKQGDDYMFAGADIANLPFTWDPGTDHLLYRGVDVTTPAAKMKEEFGVTDEALKEKAAGTLDPASDAAKNINEWEIYKAQYNEKYKGIPSAQRSYTYDDAVKLHEMANEKTYVDIGLGMIETEDGSLMAESAFNSSLSGLNFMGYGEDGNLIMVMKELGEIFTSVGDDGHLSAEDEERAVELNKKLRDAISHAQVAHVNMSADATYLQHNLERLTDSKLTLNTQIEDTEQGDPAEAITEMSWAQYCYNAALRIGNDILSQSLLDYMR